MLKAQLRRGANGRHQGIFYACASRRLDQRSVGHSINRSSSAPRRALKAVSQNQKSRITTAPSEPYTRSYDPKAEAYQEKPKEAISQIRVAVIDPHVTQRQRARFAIWPEAIRQGERDHSQGRKHRPAKIANEVFDKRREPNETEQGRQDHEYRDREEENDNSYECEEDGDSIRFDEAARFLDFINDIERRIIDEAAKRAE